MQWISHPAKKKWVKKRMRKQKHKEVETQLRTSHVNKASQLLCKADKYIHIIPMRFSLKGSQEGYLLPKALILEKENNCQKYDGYFLFKAFIILQRVHLLVKI